MDKKTLTIILAVVLIGCFFLPYMKFMGVGISGYDVVFSSGGNWEKYIYLLIPLSGVLLLIGALNNGNYILGRGLLSWLPLLTVIYIIVRPVIDGAAIGDLLKILGLGLWITLAAALVLAFYNPKPTA